MVEFICWPQKSNWKHPVNNDLPADFINNNRGESNETIDVYGNAEGMKIF